MFLSRTKPSLTSLVTFCLIVLPPLYVLSYAPVVRICGRRELGAAEVLAAAHGGNVEDYAFPPEADASLYPLYRPVDRLIDTTALQQPLFAWAEVWGVRDEFERGKNHRVRDPQSGTIDLVID